jgi:trigger factor
VKDTTSDFTTTTKDLGSCQVQLVVTVSEERFQSEVQRAARQIARGVNIPGFRKGKAPYDVIAQRYGEETIHQEAVDSLTEEVYRGALEAEDISPYAPATMESVEMDPLRYTFTVPLAPKVDLGRYRSLRVKPAKVKVKKEEVNQALERLREEFAVLEPIDDRGAQDGDALVISVEARADDSNVFIKDDVAEVVLDLENEYPAPGFFQELVGMMPGEERSFRLKMPDARPSEEAEFEVRLERLFERTLPGLDDDLARTVGDYDGLKPLRKHIENQIREKKEEEAEDEYSQRAVEALVEKAKVEYPPVALEDEVDEFVRRLADRVEREQKMSLEDYLKAIQKTEEELREEFRPVAAEQLTRNLALSEFVSAEELTVEDEEIAEGIAELSELWGIRAEEARTQLQTEVGRQAVTNNLLVKKGIERLTAIARGKA